MRPNFVQALLEDKIFLCKTGTARNELTKSFVHMSSCAVDIVTGSEHSKITKYVEEQKLLRAEEKAVKTMLDIKESE